MPLIRNSLPVRTFTRKYARYTSYKRYLRDDFHQRCGYCNDRDIICGGVGGFHIDHFRPKKHFPHLENEYNNLVYACPYCNGGKSDDWPSGVEDYCVLNGEGYIDPCDLDFDSHFERHHDGKIRPQTEVGQYMFKQLKLGLRRHELAWKMEQLEETIGELRKESERFSGNPLVKKQLDDYCLVTVDEFFKYKSMFEETI